MMTLPNKRTQIFQKTNGICIICGQEIIANQKWSIEHYIPRAIYKWINHPELQSQLENLQNLFAVHMRCNLKKDSDLPTLNKINLLHVNEELKKELRILYINIEPSIIKYRNIKQHILNKQQQKCAFCSRKITLDTATLRRINNQFLRSENNAMCLCFTCSMNAGNPYYKKEMVRKKKIHTNISNVNMHKK